MSNVTLSLHASRFTFHELQSSYMAKIKHTKNELKAQAEALKRFKRFLPMLQLKKQQLQAEIQGIDAKVDAVQAEYYSIFENLDSWVSLLSDKPVDINQYIHLQEVRSEEGNIAGVPIPLFLGADVKKAEYDLYDTPPWVDDAMVVLDKLITLRVQKEIFMEQKRLISEELRVTSQRVNLFEKVKIPECQENIRVIKIFLGDEQTAAVVRGKIAKSREK